MLGNFNFLNNVPIKKKNFLCNIAYDSKKYSFEESY